MEVSVQSISEMDANFRTPFEEYDDMIVRNANSNFDKNKNCENDIIHINSDFDNNTKRVSIHLVIIMNQESS